MRIAMLCIHFPPFPGGAAEAVYRLSSGLVKRGHTVTVYTANSWRDARAPSHEIIDGVKVRRLSKVLPDAIVLGRSFLNPMPVLRELASSNSDVIHLHGLACLGNDLTCLVQQKSPFIVTGHGPGFAYDPNRPRFLHLAWNTYMAVLGRTLVARARSVIAVTAHEIPFWRSWGVPEEKLHTIPFGVPEDCFSKRCVSDFRQRYNLDGPVLLFAGAMHALKGPQRLLMALPSVLREFPDAVAVFCGPEIGQAVSLISLARRLGVQDSVRFLGFVARDLLLDAYAACDVFVLPSNYEAFGLALAEAMAFGKPIVASRVGGVPFVVEDGGNGFLIEPLSIVDLSARIRVILGDKGLRETFGERSKELSRRYLWSAVVEDYERVYTNPNTGSLA